MDFREVKKTRNEITERKKRMKIRNKIIIAMLTSATIMTALPVAAFAAETDAVSEAFEEDQELSVNVLSYHILKAGTSELTDQVNKDDKVDVELLLQDPSWTMDSFNIQRYDIRKNDDSFSGGNIKAEAIRSDGTAIRIADQSADSEEEQDAADSPLLLKVTISDLCYKGSDRQLSIQLLDKKTGNNQECIIEIKEAVEYVEPKEDDKKQEDQTEDTKDKKEKDNDKDTVDSGNDAGSSTASFGDSYDYSFDSSGVSYGSGSSSSIDAAVPNIIIDQYGYGGKPVAAGDSFTLTTTFKNTGKLPITNIVATINGGEVFTMNGSTNTLYFEQVDAGQTQNIKVPLQVISGSKSGAKALELTFKYEYIDGTTRKNGSADINLSVPVTQPLRFEISDPKTDKDAVVGEELTITADFVNKGKGDIYNVEAEIIADNMDFLSRKQYVGSVAPGNSGTIGLVVTPQKEGENTVTVKVTYEDDDQNVQTEEYPVTIQVQPGVELVTTNMQMAAVAVAPEKSFPVVPSAIAAACAAGVGMILYVGKKKKKAAEMDLDWKDDEV